MDIVSWLRERPSIGLETPQDLIADLDQALKTTTMKGRVGPTLYRLMEGKGK